jgi:hypothetical protein
MNKKTQKGTSLGSKLAVGAGVAAAGAAAYMLFGPKGKKHRKDVKDWAVKMEGEIVKKIDNVKEMSMPVYEDIIDQVKEKYEKIKTIDREELEAVIKDLNKHWRKIASTKTRKAGSRTQTRAKK